MAVLLQTRVCERGAGDIRKRPTFATPGQTWATREGRWSLVDGRFALDVRMQKGESGDTGKDPHVPNPGKCGPPARRSMVVGRWLLQTFACKRVSAAISGKDHICQTRANVGHPPGEGRWSLVDGHDLTE